MSGDAKPLPRITEAELRAVFLLAGIEILHVDEIVNGYWPPVYVSVPPWFLVTTKYGVLKVGWRKRVLSIEWTRTKVRGRITADHVTCEEDYTHAWTFAKAVEYMTNWRQLAEALEAKENA
jgi:hypothetical protein